jgi:hypothetical protein
VAGHDDRERVAPQRLADGARRAGDSELTRKFTIGHGHPWTDESRRLIHALVELGYARHVECDERQIDRLTSEQCGHCVDRALHVVRRCRLVRPWKAPLQVRA